MSRWSKTFQSLIIVYMTFTNENAQMLYFYAGLLFFLPQCCTYCLIISGKSHKKVMLHLLYRMKYKCIRCHCNLNKNTGILAGKKYSDLISNFSCFLKSVIDITTMKLMPFRTSLLRTWMSWFLFAEMKCETPRRSIDIRKLFAVFNFTF